MGDSRRFAFTLTNCTAHAVSSPGDPLATCSTKGDTIHVLGPSEIDGQEISDAKGGLDSRSAQHVVTVSLTDRGATAFDSCTAANIGKQFAFELDSQVLSAPVIEGATNGNQTLISGNFSKETAENLAAALRFGALPAIFTE
ncbi:SecDF P1 head subdomain-containing protein [Nocardia niigatensis]